MALCSTAATILYINAFRRTSVADGAVIFAVTPFLTAGLGWLWLGVTELWATLGASLVALFGVAIMVHWAEVGRYRRIGQRQAQVLLRRGGRAVHHSGSAASAECHMKLYITPGSPYARIARIVVLEKGLESRVEVIVAQTRSANSPYYAINPSGRVPYLVRYDGVGLEESAVICAWLDHSRGEPVFDPPTGDIGWEARRLEALARSMLDGLSVWGREILRPQGERSPTVIQHEADRASRFADLWEAEVAHPWMRGALNLAQITLGCALGLEARNPHLHWRQGRPILCDWFDRIAARPSFAATAPPTASEVITARRN